MSVQGFDCPEVDTRSIVWGAPKSSSLPDFLNEGPQSTLLSCRDELLATRRKIPEGLSHEFPQRRTCYPQLPRNFPPGSPLRVSHAPAQSRFLHPRRGLSDGGHWRQCGRIQLDRRRPASSLSASCSPGPHGRDCRYTTSPRQGIHRPQLHRHFLARSSGFPPKFHTV